LLYILVGQDDFSLQRSLEEIKRETGDQALLEANTTTLDGQQVTLDQLRTTCETLPFLAGKRLVIVRGLNNHKSPSDYIVNNIPDSTILVLVDSKVSSNNPLFKELSAKAELRSFPLLRDAELRQWVQERVTEEGGSISLRAVDLITKLVGSNLWIMSNEIDKLVLFTSGRRIEEEDVNIVVSYSQEANVFAMVDAILEFKVRLAEQLLQQLLQRGAAPAYLLVMLSRQVQMVVRTKELSNQREPKAEIRHKLGLTRDFALRKTLEQANRYPWGRLKEAYRKLLEADISIKTGKYKAELALDILVAELCQSSKTY
jgi:DNA polymerase-3 subunit delta